MPISCRIDEALHERGDGRSGRTTEVEDDLHGALQNRQWLQAVRTVLAAKGSLVQSGVNVFLKDTWTRNSSLSAVWPSKEQRAVQLVHQEAGEQLPPA